MDIKKSRIGLWIGLAALLASFSPEKSAAQDLSDLQSAVSAGLRMSQADKLMFKKGVFYNEARGRYELLTHWNGGEEFPSLGLGHFLWYPEGYQGKNPDDFPAVLQFLAAKGVELPDWMKPGSRAPWPNRNAFCSDFYSRRMIDLRYILVTTLDYQTEFLLERGNRSLSAMLARVPENERPDIEKQFKRVTSTPVGIYAVFDLVNFKGESRLLQALKGMSQATPSASPIKDFADAAQIVLDKILEDKDPDYVARWKPNWKQHVDTYRAENLTQLLAQGYDLIHPQDFNYTRKPGLLCDIPLD